MVPSLQRLQYVTAGILQSLQLPFWKRLQRFTLLLTVTLLCYLYRHVSSLFSSLQLFVEASSCSRPKVKSILHSCTHVSNYFLLLINSSSSISPEWDWNIQWIIQTTSTNKACNSPDKRGVYLLVYIWSFCGLLYLISVSTVGLRKPRVFLVSVVSEEFSSQYWRALIPGTFGLMVWAKQNPI